MIELGEIPPMEDTLITFPGSGNCPTVFAAFKRGRKARVLK